MYRPTSPYLVFLKQNTNQNLSLKQRAALWQALSPQQKEVYVNKFNELRRQYQVNLSKEKDQLEDIDRPKQKQKDDGKKNYLFPLAKIKTIAKAEGEVGQIRHEALIQLSKATQFFLQEITKDMARHSDKKRLGVQDLYDCFQRHQEFWFLRGVVSKQNKVREKDLPKEKNPKEKDSQQLQLQGQAAPEKPVVRGALDMFFGRKD